MPQQHSTPFEIDGLAPDPPTADELSDRIRALRAGFDALQVDVQADREGLAADRGVGPSAETLSVLSLLEAWSTLPGPCRDGVLQVAKAAIAGCAAPMGTSPTTVRAAERHLRACIPAHHLEDHEPTRWLLHELAVWLDEVAS